MGKRSLTTLALLLLLVGTSELSTGQSLDTPGDPFGLKWIGMPKRLEKHGVVATPEVPPDSTTCAPGVFFLNATKANPKKTVSLKLVVITLRPNIPFVLDRSPFKKEKEDTADSATYSPIYSPPKGYTAVTFLWPAQLRTGQLVRFQRTGSADGSDTATETRHLEAPSEIDLKEGKDALVAWTIDTHLGPNALVRGGPLLLKISLPKDAIKCLKQ